MLIGIKDETLKKDIKFLIKKYRIVVSCMEQSLIEETIQRSIESNNSEIVKEQLHGIIAPSETRDNGYTMYNVGFERE